MAKAKARRLRVGWHPVQFTTRSNVDRNLSSAGIHFVIAALQDKNATVLQTEQYCTVLYRIQKRVFVLF
jgi:hypothetical protein